MRTSLSIACCDFKASTEAMRLYLIITFCSLITLSNAESSENSDEAKKSETSEKVDKEFQKRSEMRRRRQIPLVFPYGGTYKLLVGFAMPIPNDDKISLSFAANLQYQYLQFQNITQASQYYSYLTVSRGERALDDAEARRDERLVFYKAAEAMLTSKGFDGRECVLRAMCEVAQYPVEQEGLVGEILHILLTPQYGREPVDRTEDAESPELADYTRAARAGEQMFHCGSVYTGCPEGQGVLELVSMLSDQ